MLKNSAVKRQITIMYETPGIELFQDPKTSEISGVMGALRVSTLLLKSHGLSWVNGRLLRNVPANPRNRIPVFPRL
jgi:hypothetical protein